MKLCSKCDHLETWHHGNQKQEDYETGKKYIRTCFGIACTCGEKF